MNSSTRDIVGTFSIVVTVISIVIGVISLLPKREDPKIEKPTNANNIAVNNNSPKEPLHPSNQNQIHVEKQPEKVNYNRMRTNELATLPKLKNQKGERAIVTSERAGRMGYLRSLWKMPGHPLVQFTCRDAALTFPQIRRRCSLDSRGDYGHRDSSRGMSSQIS